MNLQKWLRPVVTALTIAMPFAYGDNTDGKSRFQVELEESDMEVLNDFINAKRKIPLIDKSKALKISGELHTEWNYYRERLNGKTVRVFVFDEEETINDDVYNPGDTIAIGPDDYDIQADLFIDWDTDRTWARMHVRFDNAAGVDDNGEDEHIDPQGYHGSGTCNKLCVKEAYIGYEIFKCNDHRLTIEVGRRGAIYKAFYSEIEFASRLDGILLKYSTKLKNFSDFYLQWAGFVVDERATECAWVTEVGLGNIKNTGVDLKYSYIDWTKWGKNRYGFKHPLGFRFKVSQVSFVCNWMPKFLCGQPVQVFGGYLVNHTPSGKTYVNINPNPGQYTAELKYIGRKHNHGGFFGMQYREIHKEGDWLLRAMLAYCEAQCIPDNDVRNIGTGNFLDDSFTSKGRGNVNWKGYALKLGYAITDQLIVEMLYDHSWSIDNSIAGTHSYIRYCLETTYCF